MTRFLLHPGDGAELRRRSESKRAVHVSSNGLQMRYIPMALSAPTVEEMSRGVDAGAHAPSLSRAALPVPSFLSKHHPETPGQGTERGPRGQLLLRLPQTHW